MAQIALEYRRLTAEEREELTALGQAGTLARRHGFKAFGDAPSARAQPQQHPGMLPGAVRMDGALVAADAPAADLGIALAHNSPSFLDRYEKFKITCKAEGRDAPVLTAAQEAARPQFQMTQSISSCVRGRGCRAHL